MEILVQVVLFLLLAKGSSLLLDSYYQLPPPKTQNGLKLVMRKKSFTEKLTDEAINPLINLLEPFIRISEEKEMKLKYSLARAGIKDTPKEYYARAIVMTIMALPLPAALFMMGLRQLVPVGFVLAGVIGYQQLSSYKSELKKKTELIEMGLPGFIRSILYKLNDSKSGVIKADLISIFQDYRRVANPVFAWDISTLIMEMQVKDIEVALRSFNNRLAIPEVGFLCNALIGLTRGEYQNETLSALAREMDIKSKENIRRELDKRPGKVMAACMPLFLVSFVAIGYVLIVAMTGGIADLA